MPQYRLARDYFDGVLHKKGSIVEFPEDKAPKGAVLFDGKATEVEAPEASTPELEIQPDLLGLDSDMTTLSAIAAGGKKK